jgi:protein-S-isoprenylcysteine O-methyltransferase Ste14
VQRGELWGIGTPAWFWLAVVTPIAHQVFVWFCWRTQLHAKLLARLLGKGAFAIYASGFAILGAARVTSIVLLSEANRDTLPVNAIIPRIAAIVAAVPAAYLFYSVARYFGFLRATGRDHFDESYRTRGLERRGIFRFTNNGMYIFGFLLMWLPGLWYASAAGLCVALYNHLYIWVHYFATEKPDMRHIYGPRPADDVGTKLA